MSEKVTYARGGATSRFREQLREEVDRLWVLDAHEHLYLPAERDEKANDCFYLTSHYLRDDLVSAGMEPALVAALQDTTVPLERRWASVTPHWEYARTTGYGQAVQLTARELFGVDGLSAATYQELSQRVAATRGREDWYEHVLKTKSRFVGCIADIGSTEGDRRYFLPVMRFDQMIVAGKRADIQGLKECREREVGSLQDYLAAMDAAFERYVAAGIVGLKCGLAYRRPIHFEQVSRAEAEPLFDRALRDDLPPQQATRLQDFLFHEVCDRAAAHGLPFQIHTGLQAGNRGTIQWTNPALLTNTLKAHPMVRFDLFHGGYPYGGELAALAKNYANAFINACWLAIIAPTVLRRQLHEWLDTVPHNKIQAFGGDFRPPELSYGHALMARAAVADVLAERVEAGFLAESDAPLLARRLLADNGIALFKLPPAHVTAATSPLS